MIADARAVAARWTEPRMRAIAALATVVTEAPWRATRPAELADEVVLHVVALSAFFGHLNRIADATGVPLDYEVLLAAPAAEPATPAYEVAPDAIADVGVSAPRLSLAARPATAAAFAAWREDLFDRDAPLARSAREAIAARADGLLGRAPLRAADGLTSAQLALVDVVIRAPWALGGSAYAALRAEGADDALVFDLCATASTASMLARIDVALRCMR